MRRQHWIVLLSGLLLAVGCGSQEEDPPADGGGGLGVWQATLTDHADPVTDGGQDDLFTLRIDRAGTTVTEDRVFPYVVQPDQSHGDLRFVLTEDADQDGEVGQGDLLTIHEPGASWVNAADIGSDLQVGLDVKGEGSLVVFVNVWEGTWRAE